MKNRTILGLYWLFVLVTFSIVTGYAQEQTPVPPSPSISASINSGVVNPLNMVEVSAQTNASIWIQNYGITGNGVRIGVLDKGFKSILDFETRAGIEVLIYSAHDKADYNNNDATEHGTQALETIHTIAPDATLFACRYISYQDFRSCVDWLAGSVGVNIINHSGGVPAIGLNNWAGEVDFATQRGVLWINSVGNFGQGVVEDYFTDQSGNLDGTPNGFHEFRGTSQTGNQAETIILTPVNTGIERIGIVMLSWDKPSVALELKVTYGASSPPNIIAESTYQYTYVDMNQPFNIGVRGGQDALGTRFLLYVEFMDIIIARTIGSVIIPANSPHALTVGALEDTRTIAPYSSLGPAEFNGININKPDLVTFGAINLHNGVFVGTSASSAITAGVAALAWQSLSSLSPATNLQVRQYLLTNVSPPSEPDITFGNGSLRLPINLPTVTITPIPPTPTPTQDSSMTLTVTNPGGANIRNGPGVEYDVLYTVGQNTSFEATHYTNQNDGWFKINYRSNPNAWISKSVVDYSAQALTLPVPTYIPPLPISTPTPNNPNPPVPTTLPNPPTGNSPVPPAVLNVYATGDAMVCNADNKFFYLNMNINNPSSMPISIETTYGTQNYPAFTSQASGVFVHPQPFKCILTQPNGQCSLDYRITINNGSGTVLAQGTLIWNLTQTPCP